MPNTALIWLVILILFVIAFGIFVYSLRERKNRRNYKEAIEYLGINIFSTAEAFAFRLPFEPFLFDRDIWIGKRAEILKEINRRRVAVLLSEARQFVNEWSYTQPPIDEILALRQASRWKLRELLQEICKAGQLGSGIDQETVEAFLLLYFAQLRADLSDVCLTNLMMSVRSDEAALKSLGYSLPEDIRALISRRNALFLRMVTEEGYH